MTDISRRGLLGAAGVFAALLVSPQTLLAATPDEVEQFYGDVAAGYVPEATLRLREPLVIPPGADWRIGKLTLIADGPLKAFITGTGGCRFQVDCLECRHDGTALDEVRRDRQMTGYFSTRNATIRGRVVPA